MTRAWYAEKVCEMMAHGEQRHYSPQRWGWGDYLARWIWLNDKNLDRDP